MKQITAVIIGAGNRGASYSDTMATMPEKFKVVAVADIEACRREDVRKTHGFGEEMCFETWQELLSRPKMADLAVIATMDHMHYEPAMKAIELGYDLLLEKPVAPTAEQCAQIAVAAQKKGVRVLVSHVLRYTDFYKKVKTLVMNGAVGRVMSAVMVEALGNIHQSHSYVRGNWCSESKAAPMLLAKSCHDLDLIQWLLQEPCRRVQSFGRLSYFCSENAPAGAPVRCSDGGCPVEDSCPYNCRKVYKVTDKPSLFRNAVAKGFCAATEPTQEEINRALEATDYGLCVFHANNDVVDHQVVNMEFASGATVSFSMNAFNQGGRYIRLFGTEGELYANMSDDKITVYSFRDKQRTEHPVSVIDETIHGGHGGGDQGIIRELYEYLSGEYRGFCAADIGTSVKNHLIGFAAERARNAGNVVDVNAFFREYGLENEYEKDSCC